ncbi:hypothetical protein ACSMXN_05450 [Jatrophihabitans sp. DSM 45814]
MSDPDDSVESLLDAIGRDPYEERSQRDRAIRHLEAIIDTVIRWETPPAQSLDFPQSS